MAPTSDPSRSLTLAVLLAKKLRYDHGTARVQAHTLHKGCDARANQGPLGAPPPVVPGALHPFAVAGIPHKILKRYTIAALLVGQFSGRVYVRGHTTLAEAIAAGSLDASAT